MQTQLIKLCGAIALALLAGTSQAQTATPPTDAQVLQELATFKPPAGRPAPTLAEFRAAQISDGIGDNPRPATLAEFRNTYQWQHVGRDLAEKYYADVLKSEAVVDNLLLAFVLKDQTTVLAHASSTVKPPAGTSVRKNLARIFPEHDVANNQRTVMGCYDAKPGKHAEFCVAYAVLK